MFYNQVLLALQRCKLFEFHRVLFRVATPCRLVGSHQHFVGIYSFRRKQLLDDLDETRRYWKLKEEALDRTLWRTRFEGGYGPVAREITE
jgi:hypothetical protein